MTTGPLVRVVDASLGPDAQVRLVLSGVSGPDRLRSAWASSGAAVEAEGQRLRATTTVAALARAAGRALDAEEARQLDHRLRRTVAAWRGGPPALALRNGSLATDARPQVMGVVNVTPDSFSDGGRVYPDGHPGAGIALGRRLLEEGADVLDVGGESTRPGADPVPADEEQRRVLPVVEALAADGAVVSIDTSKAEVARAAVAAGATVVNDVSGAADPALLGVVAATGAGYVLMHTRGTPADMTGRATYDDVVAEVYEFLADGLVRCAGAGVDLRRVAVDPGIGFAKTGEHNLALLRALPQLRGLGRPVLVGASRKSFLGAILDGAGPDDRLEGSLACAAVAVTGGASLLRVHEVAATVRTAKVVHAVAAGSIAWPVGPRRGP